MRLVDNNCLPDVVMEDSGDRLREARIEAGFTSGRAAALALGIPPATYAAHENGSRRYNTDVAQRYAAFFRVSASWLLMGVQDHIFNTGPNERTQISLARKQFGRGGLLGDEDIPKSSAQLLVSDTNKWDGKTVQSVSGASGPRSGLPEAKLITIKVPEISSRPADTTEEGAIFEKYAIRRNWTIPAPFIMDQLHGQLSKLHMIEVADDAMERTLKKGSCVFVNLKRNTFEEDGLYVVLCDDGRYQPRRLQRAKNDLSGDIHVMCDSKSIDDKQVPETELDIAGKVIGIVSSI